MEVNADAIRQAIKGLEANPANWNQKAWIGIAHPDIPNVSAINDVKFDDEAGTVGFSIWNGIRHEVKLVQAEQCHTTYCLAGQAMLDAGMVDERGRYTDVDGHELNSSHEAEKLAADLLGLTEAQADQIFYWGVNFGGGPLGEFKRHITKVTGVKFED